MKIQSLFMH